MKILNTNFYKFFIILTIICKTVAKINIQIWGNESSKIIDYSKLNITNINSLALDNNTDTKLFIGEINDTSYFFLNKTDSEIKIIENNLKVENIINPLMEGDSSDFYFCSSSFPNLMRINDTKVEVINNTFNIQKLEKSNVNFTLKCYITTI